MLKTLNVRVLYIPLLRRIFNHIAICISSPSIYFYCVLYWTIHDCISLVFLLQPVTEVQSFPQPNVMSAVDNCNYNSNGLTKCTKTHEQSDTSLLARGMHSSTAKQTNDGSKHAYDLLDFLDHVGTSTETTLEPSAHLCLSPKISLSVSLPRKPCDDSPSPQQRFYPRKLYWFRLYIVQHGTFCTYFIVFI